MRGESTSWRDRRAIWQHQKRRSRTLDVAGRKTSTSRLSILGTVLYTLQAAYPYANAKKGECNLDCNVVLKSGDKKTKVVARVFSTGSALDAMSMTKVANIGLRVALVVGGPDDEPQGSCERHESSGVRTCQFTTDLRY